MAGNPNTIPIAELASRRLWRPLVKARLAEEASSTVAVEPAELEMAWQAFCKKHQIDPSNPSAVPQDFLGCAPAALRSVVEREIRIARWKTAVFGLRAQEHFEKRKPDLDRIVYSLLRVKDAGLARELWFRVKEGEATFAELAPRYASGNEIYTAGIIGPVPFGAIHPALAAVLRAGRPGELLNPFSVAEWFLVARVEHHLPAEFDEAMKHQITEELAGQWLDSRIHELTRT